MFKIVPTVAHAGSTKIFITDQTRLLQYKRVYNSTKILTLEIIFSAQTSNTNVLFQHKYVYCTINQIFFLQQIYLFSSAKIFIISQSKKKYFSLIPSYPALSTQYYSCQNILAGLCTTDMQRRDRRQLSHSFIVTSDNGLKIYPRYFTRTTTATFFACEKLSYRLYESQ